jgi:hypothetical protein
MALSNTLSEGYRRNMRKDIKREGSARDSLSEVKRK